jgi:hypothetical protein
MRYWFDTEFYEHDDKIDLISIGLVAEDDRELYLQCYEADYQHLTPWLLDNVWSKLTLCKREAKPHPQCDISCPWLSRTAIAARIKKYIAEDERPEFWGYYADYDWVIFCQIFSGMLALPKNYPMYCRDLKQFVDQLGNPRLPKQTAGEHNALWDARWTRDAWQWAQAYARQHEYAMWPT